MYKSRFGYKYNPLKEEQLEKEMVVCPCHPAKTYDNAKHRACYRCYQQQYKCCDQRLLQQALDVSGKF